MINGSTYSPAASISSNGSISSSVKSVLLEEAKRNAAYACVDDLVSNGQKIGLGTGSTAVFAVERIAEKYKAGKLRDIICVPSSFDTKHLLIENHLPLSNLDQHYQLDLYIDGADEIDENLNCIKGGGGCLTEEKIVQNCAKNFYLIVDYRKKSTELGQQWKYIPIEVCRTGHVPLAKRIESAEGGICKLRSGSGKAGPLITDQGNFILDWYFPSSSTSASNGPTTTTTISPSNKPQPRDLKYWTRVHQRLKLMTGVVETGLFLNVARKAYIGLEDGSVERLEAALAAE